MKCKDSECGHEFDRSESDYEYNTMVEQEDYSDGPCRVEVLVRVRVTFLCPVCGDLVEEAEGESSCNVEVEDV